MIESNIFIRKDNMAINKIYLNIKYLYDELIWEILEMGKFQDLTGRHFGMLTVMYRSDDYIQPSGQHKVMWHCKCECGRECDVRSNDLKSGNTSSCGCLQQFSRGKAQFQDLTGNRYGRLTVLYRLPNHITPSGQQQRMWKCVCDCGNEINVYATQLKNGLSSCGCIQKEKKIEELRKREIARMKAREEKLQEKKKEVKLQIQNKKKLQKKAVNERYKKEKLLKDSLENKFPDIAKEWDYSKNGGMTPKDVFSGSGKKVWWICSLGHSYCAAISNRTGKGKNGCPYCSIPAKRVLKGFNDLASKYPELANEWHPTKNQPLKPDNVLCGSGKKVWWLGKCGHEFKQSIISRVNGSGCPYCSNQKLLPGYNDFATIHPELLSEWDYEKNNFLPTEISVGTKKKVWWKCPFGHNYQAYPYNRCGKSHTGCPICNKENHTSFPEQALYYYIKKYHPDAINSDKTVIGMELDIYIPSLKIAIEYDGRNWHNNNLYEEKKNLQCKKQKITLIRIREEGLCLYDNCYCIIRYDVRNEKSLTDVIKQILNYIDNLDDIDINVTRDASAIYSSYIVTRKSQSLLTIAPQIAQEWHPIKNGNLTPEMIAPMSSKKVWWLGKCGHEWQMSVQDRVNQNCGCPICSGKRIVSGINDLQTNFPDLCLEWNYELNNKLDIKPNLVTSHSDKKVWWTCRKCGHIWRAKIDSRTRMKAGCPECGKRIVSESKYKPVRCIETGKIYKSLQTAEINTGINRNCIGNCCKGKQKTAGKLHWEYVI